jgi:hypothetical protein
MEEKTWQQLQTWSVGGLLATGRWQSPASSMRHETAVFAAWIDPEAIGQWACGSSPCMDHTARIIRTRFADDVPRVAGADGQ